MDTEPEFKKQVLTEITLGSIISSAISGIIGYIAVYFFKPLWEKIVKMWDKTDVH
jgi:hypothetical protein